MRRVARALSAFAVMIAVTGVAFYFAMRAEVSRIERFCDRVVPQETNVSQLPAIADDVGVYLRGPAVLTDGSGSYLFLVAPSYYTVGEYACRIRGDVATGRVTRKRAGT